jgi:CBS domain containing-hemolysin-like protein
MCCRSREIILGGGLRFDVVDMGGRRIDMILVQRQSDETAAVET